MTLERALHAMIGSLNDGGMLHVLRVGIVLMLLVVLFGFYAWSEYRGLDDPEAMELAQLGRALARGEGFTTRCLRPVDAGALSGGTFPERVPDLRHAPLYPLLAAAGFALVRPAFGAAAFRYAPEYMVLLPLGILLSIAAGLAVYRLGLRLVSPRAALLAAAGYCVGDAVLGDAAAGAGLPLATLCTAAAFLAADRAARRLEGGGAFARALPALAAAGAACGLAFLTRYTLAVLPAALAVFFGRRLTGRRAAAAAVVLGVALLVAAPWVARNLAVCGRPLGLAPHAVFNDTVFFGAHGFDRVLAPELAPPRAAFAIRAKLLHNLGGVFDTALPALGNGIFMALFIVALFHPFAARGPAALRDAALTGLLLLAPCVALGPAAGAGVLRVFLPYVVLVGTACFLDLVDRMELFDAGWEIVLGWLLVALAALPTVLRLAAPGGRSPYPPYAPPYIAALCRMLDAGETLVTDIPWATAWYGDRRSLLLPDRVDALAAPPADAERIGGIYLAGEPALWRAPDRSWALLRERRVPETFAYPFGLDLPPDTRAQLFLSDRERWAAPGDSTPPRQGQ
jgi:hypothetical protein